MGMISKIFQRCSEELKTQDPWVRRIFHRITACGTGELGTSTFFCTTCNTVEKFGAGCGSRNCPSCGGQARRNWVERASERLFPVKHFHAVFTVPHQLNSLIAAHPRTLLDLLMKTVSATLLKFSEKTLNGRPAFMMVLHTWTQSLQPHYHVHVLIAAGSFSDGKWKPHHREFLFPIRALSTVFRAKFLEGMLNLTQNPESALHNKKLPWLPSRWNVYCAAPYNGSETAIKYFGRYANRVGISDSRVLGTSDTEVTIALKKDSNDRDPSAEKPRPNPEKKQRTLVLSIAEFIARFIIHILPRGFSKIRYGGLYAAKSKQRKEIKETLLKKNKEKAEASPITKLLRKCIACGKQTMIFVSRTAAPQRWPP